MDSLSQLVPIALFSLYGKPFDFLVVLSYKMWQNWNVVQPYAQVFSSHLNFKLIVVLATLVAALLLPINTARCLRGFQALGTTQSSFVAKPMLFPCRTAHTRLFPKKHHFSYSFLLAGIPVGWKGEAGGMLGVDLPVVKKNWIGNLISLAPWSPWYTVDAADHLARGHVEGGLKEKLHDYLLSQGENPESYPYAYLMTPPRLLGYYSNPVSIWSLYSSTKTVSAMILEVNNTFNERHSYFLKADPVSAASQKSDVQPRFTQHWPKDFHVSVFNSREGSYSISSSDPLHPNLSGPGLQNTTITLSSSKSHPKLIARVFSTCPAVDPTTMSSVEKITFLSRWWWVSFATFPRTVHQAAKIMWEKGLHFVSRPEPRGNTIPRSADSIEHLIEPLFRGYLRRVVGTCEKPLILKYVPSGVLDTIGETIVSQSASSLPKEKCEYLEVKVLTPLFYSRFVAYPEAVDGLLSEYHESHTISISNPDILDSLKFSTSVPPLYSPDAGPNPKLDKADRVRLAVLRLLRSRPHPIENNEATKQRLKLSKLSPPSLQRDNLSTRSDFDHYAISHSLPPEKQQYILSVAKLFLADKFAWGSMELLAVQMFLFRCGFGCLVARYCT